MKTEYHSMIHKISDPPSTFPYILVLFLINSTFFSVVDTIGVYKLYEWVNLATFTRFSSVFAKDNVQKRTWRKFLHRRCFCRRFYFFSQSFVWPGHNLLNDCMNLTSLSRHKNSQNKKNTNEKFQNLKVHNYHSTITYISTIVQLHIKLLYNYVYRHTLQLRFYNFIYTFT